MRCAGGAFAPGHLGELTRIVPFEMVDAVLTACGKTQQRTRLIPARVGVYLLLAAGLFAHLGWGGVWDKLTAGLEQRPGPSGSALFYARKRLGAAPLRALFELLAGPGASTARWRGLLVVAIDGTEIEAPDTDANRERLGVHGSGTGQSGYPRLRLVAAVAAGTRSLLAATWGTIRDTEQTLALELLPHLGPGHLLLADRGFAAAALLDRLARTGTEILVRIPAHWKPKTLARLADGTRLVQIGTRRLRLVEAEITINTTGGSRTGAYRLATTLTDPADHDALDLVELYHQRWEIETAYMELKSGLLRRTVLRSGDPAGLDQEIWALLCLYQVLRSAIDNACTASDLTPIQASFTRALECARDLLIQAAGIIEDEQIDLAGRIGAELIARPLPARRSRTAPRAIKRAISKHRAKGAVTRRTYKATLEIALINSP